MVRLSGGMCDCPDRVGAGTDGGAGYLAATITYPPTDWRSMLSVGFMQGSLQALFHLEDVSPHEKEERTWVY